MGESKPIHVAGFATLNDVELLFHIANYSENNTELSYLADNAWLELRERHWKNLLIIMYKVIYNRHYKEGYDEAKEVLIEQLADETFSKVKTVAKNYSKEKGEVMPWLCQIAKNLFRDKIKQGVWTMLNQSYDEMKEVSELGEKRKLTFEASSEADSELILNKKEEHIKLVREFFKDKYSEIEIEAITAYYEYYDSSKKSHHVPKELIERFRKEGLADDRRTKLISRLKPAIKKALENIINK